MLKRMILFLVFGSCVLSAVGRSIPHGPAKLDEPSYNEGIENDGKTTSTLEQEGKRAGYIDFLS